MSSYMYVLEDLWGMRDLTQRRPEKNEYDTSKQEDEKASQATGSIFQGLRADIDGYVLVGL